MVLFPTYQVIRPQRDVNAEETVAANFLKIRREAGLTSLKRVEGGIFSEAACEAAAHGSPEKVWVENANYAATIYSTTKPDDLQQISALATRTWKTDQRFLVGACLASTPTFPSGRYWIAMGVVGGVSEKSVADLLSGKPVTTRAVVTTQQIGE
jgi:hypothetical protein